MSKFRDGAAEVKAAGEEARGDFTPNGVPKRMYQWWLENSPSEKASDIRLGKRRENFCHFWRVVAIWVPLMWLAEKTLTPVLDAADRINPKTALLSIVILVVGIAALIATSTGTWIEVLIVCAWILGIAAVAAAIATVVYMLHEHTENGFEILVASALGIAFLGFFGALIVDFGFLPVLLWTLAIVAGIAAFIAGAIFVGTLIENLRADSKKRAVVAEEAAWEAYTNDEGPHPYARTPREPGAFSKFLTGIGDFLTLAAQVVRVNKWKICPLVEVDVPAQPERAPLWDENGNWY